MSLTALETQYKGFRFRSRTEARWAVFFDAIGIKWDYEKDGYDLGTEGRYLPDFWLSESQVYAEVKGQEFTVREVNICRALARLSKHPVVMLPGSPEARDYQAEKPNGLLGMHEWAVELAILEAAAARARTARFEHGESPSQERITHATASPAISPLGRVRRGERRERLHGAIGASAEREIMRVMITMRSRVEQIAANSSAESFRDPAYRAIYDALVAGGPDATVEDLSAVLNGEAVGVLNDILSEGAFQIDPERTISDGLAALRMRDLSERAAELDRLIPLVEGAQKDNLIEEKLQIRDELKRGGNGFKTFRRPVR